MQQIKEHKEEEEKVCKNRKYKNKIEDEPKAVTS